MRDGGTQPDDGGAAYPAVMTSTPHRLAQATDQLLRTAGRLSEGDQVEPSLCAGWSRGHVLTHLARNADGMARLVRAAVDGSGEAMYASVAQREADIEAGSARPLAELVDDVTASAEALAAELARLTPAHELIEVQRTPGGATFRAGELAFRRLREVVYHHVDLDAGFRFGDLSADLLSLFLDEEVSALQDGPLAPSLVLRTDEGDEHVVADGLVTVSGSRAALLGWLARGLTEGVRCDGPLPALPSR